VVRGAVVKEARECEDVLLGLVMRGGNQVERGATLGYTGRGRKEKNKLDSSRGSVPTET
jgi:hypothetical protein